MSLLVTRSHTGPPVAHHESCSRVRSSGAEVCVEKPPDALWCRWCHGKPPAAWKAILKAYRAPGKPRRFRPVADRNWAPGERPRGGAQCPSCESLNIDRDGPRRWVCWNCPWSGDERELHA